MQELFLWLLFSSNFHSKHPDGLPWTCRCSGSFPETTQGLFTLSFTCSCCSVGAGVLDPGVHASLMSSFSPLRLSTYLHRISCTTFSWLLLKDCGLYKCHPLSSSAFLWLSALPQCPPVGHLPVTFLVSLIPFEGCVRQSLPDQWFSILRNHPYGPQLGTSLGFIHSVRIWNVWHVFYLY